MKRHECIQILAKDRAESLTREALENVYVRFVSKIMDKFSNDELEDEYNIWFSPDTPIEIEES